MLEKRKSCGEVNLIQVFAGDGRARTVVAALFLVLIAGFTALKAAAQDNVVIVLPVTGPIGPATSDYVVRGLDTAEEQAARAVVLKIDTPGGLDTSMREIVQAILASPVAVIGYVAPSGARAASAGTFILYATHLAAMAPATNLGAATPVEIRGLPLPGGDPRQRQPEENEDDTESETEEETEKTRARRPTVPDKVMRDAVAYIRGLAQLHGRNAEWAEKAVTEAATLSAGEALEAGVIDLIANDINELLEEADGRTVKLLGREFVVETAGASTVPIEPDWRTDFLSVITTPTVAYILLLIGFYGIVFEFWSPGFTGPGVIGAICLVLALFALNQLPINYAGLGLIILGMAFMLAEAFVPAFGILGIGGVISFIVGSVLLLETDAPGFRVSPGVIAAVGGTSALLFLGVLIMLGRSRTQPVVSGPEEMIGLEGEIIDWKGAEGRVRTHGEIWRASAAEPLSPGTHVRVIAMDGLTLVVQPLE